MTSAVNRRAYRQARRLIEQGRFVHDEREAWSEHHPTTKAESDYIATHGFAAYAEWFLATNSAYQQGTTRHHELPYGDFTCVHRCALLAARMRAVSQKNAEVEQAAAGLLALIEAHSG